MAKQTGRKMLIKISDGASTPVFMTLCGLNSKSLTLNNSSVDVTTPDCDDPNAALWTQTLPGVKNMSVTGDGYFEDSVAEARMNAVALSDETACEFEIHVPDFGVYAGVFRIASADFGGETEGGVTYSLSLESNGAITFAAAV